MVPTNHTEIEKKLDGVRLRRQKFICLNDNMNHSNPESRKVVRVLHDFLEVFFPFPSPLELPKGRSNQFLHVDEYQQLYGRSRWLVSRF